MDARITVAAVAAALLIHLVGCFPPSTTRNPEPQIEPARQPADDAPAEERSEIVDAEGDVDDGLDERITAYIQRVDDLQTRAAAAPVPGGERMADTPHVEAPPRFAADEKRIPPPSTPNVEIQLDPEMPTQPPVPNETAVRVRRAGIESDVTEDESSPKRSSDQGEEAELPTPAEVVRPELNVPVLGAVRVQVASPIARQDPDELDQQSIPASGVNQPAVAADAPFSLQDYLERLPHDPKSASFREQLDVRILRLLSGDHAGARELLQGVTPAQQEIASGLIEALITLQQSGAAATGEASEAVIERFHALAAELDPLGSLAIPTIALCSQVRGFGQYEPIEPPTFASGRANEFIVYCELQHFASRQREDGLYESRFDMRTQVLDRRGQPVREFFDQDIVDACRNRRRDCFIPRLVRVPADLSPGQYVVKVTIIDKLGERLAESRSSFRLVAAP